MEREKTRINLVVLDCNYINKNYRCKHAYIHVYIYVYSLALSTGSSNTQ